MVDAFANFTTKASNKLKYIDEGTDLGHRHFSSLQWLYPGLFIPNNNKSSDIFKGALQLMIDKVKDGTGHTSWSASWEACLWARLGKGDELYSALKRIIQRYSAHNLLSLHPPLRKKSDLVGTVYREATPYQPKDRKTTAGKNRGLKTNDKSPVMICYILNV